MALNLWKAAGKPTAYNPLPAGFNNRVSIGIGEYVLKFKAKSSTLAILRFQSSVGAVRINDGTSLEVSLHDSLTEFIYSIKSAVVDNLILVDKNSSGDIIITDIELVEKPLPKLTVNGIDGFLSGKWTLHANAKVIDDETLELNATSSNQATYLNIPCLPNTTYTMSIGTLTSDRFVCCERATENGGDLVFQVMTSAGNKTFTTGSSTKVLHVRMYSSSSMPSGKFIFKRPMLNLGSVPAPYEKKLGDKMVLPVPKKNLITYQDIRNINSTPSTPDTWDYAANNTRELMPDDSYKITTSLSTHVIRYTFLARAGKTYTFSFKAKKGTQSTWKYSVYDSGNNAEFISATPYPVTLSEDEFKAVSFNFTPTKDAKLSVYLLRDSYSLGTTYYKDFQLEEGTTATPYEPYTLQMNKRPAKPVAKQKGGLRMDGVSNYLQLPSMTMDSVEIDCLIDSVQPFSVPKIIDARTGMANGWANDNNGNLQVFTGTWKEAIGYKKGERTTMRFVAFSPFTDNVNIFSGYLGDQNLKGILYGIKCFLNGVVVAEYDFTNPNNIVGDKVLQNAKNLIPSFEDSRWNLHANARVYGKDVLKLEASGTYQHSPISIPVEIGKTYRLTSILPGRQINVYRGNSVNGPDYFTSIDSVTPVRDFVATTSLITISCTNAIAGTFEFIKPQLYELSGSEGTVYGAPTRGLKPSKRTLYAKR